MEHNLESNAGITINENALSIIMQIVLQYLEKGGEN